MEKLHTLCGKCTCDVFSMLLCILGKQIILPPFGNVGHIFLQLCLLSVSAWPALLHLWMPPNTELALPRDTCTHTHTRTFWQKWCQSDLRHATILHHCLGPPLPLYPSNHYPAPHLIEPASGQARPALPSCVWSSTDLPDTSSPSIHIIHFVLLHPQLPHHNPSHHLSPDGWGLGIDGRLVASVLAMAICFVSPRKTRRTVACGFLSQPASQLALPRAAVSKNTEQRRGTLTHCHRAVQRDWSGPFRPSSQVWGRPGLPAAPLAPFSPLWPWHPI